MESSDDKKRMIESDNEQRPNKLEVSRETRFTSGSKYEGTSWNAVDKTGIGRYVTPHGVVLEGEYRNGMLHGHGSMHWPLGQRIDGTWNRGKITQKRYTFADGLSYEEEGWEYCTLPDRRFYNCIVSGLRPAPRVLKSNRQPSKIVPPFCYDTGAGIFDPRNSCVMSYRNCKKVIKIPTTAERMWIKRHCRKGWSEPTGHHAWLHEYWQSGAANFPMVPPEDETEDWWQRLTNFARHSFAEITDET